MFSHFLLCNHEFYLHRTANAIQALFFLFTSYGSGCIYHFHGSTWNIDCWYTHTHTVVTTNSKSFAGMRWCLFVRFYLHSATLLNVVIKANPTDRNLQPDCVVIFFFFTIVIWSQSKTFQITSNILDKISDSFIMTQEYQHYLLDPFVLFWFDFVFFLEKFIGTWNKQWRNPTIYIVLVGITTILSINSLDSWNCV